MISVSQGRWQRSCLRDAAANSGDIERTHLTTPTNRSSEFSASSVSRRYTLPSGMSPLLAEHLAYEIGGVLRAEFLHHVRTVKFDGARTDAERPRGFFAGRAPHDLSQRYAFPRRQRVMAWKRRRQNVERTVQLLDVLLGLPELAGPPASSDKSCVAMHRAGGNTHHHGATGSSPWDFSVDAADGDVRCLTKALAASGCVVAALTPAV